MSTPHQHFLLDIAAQLEQVHQQSPHEQNVGSIFLDLAVAMKVYITYCSNHPAACQRLQELRKNVPAMNDFLEACASLVPTAESPSNNSPWMRSETENANAPHQQSS